MHSFPFGRTTIAILFAASVLSANLASADEISWFTKLDSATQVAAQGNKLVLLHFTSEASRDGRTVDTYVYTHPAVQREFNQNVVGVRIDAPSQKSLVQEYGVPSLPYDVVITPAGRVVMRRKSPTNASSYQKMLTDLSGIINSLGEGSDPSLKQSLAEIEEAMNANPRLIAQTASFTPELPTHDAPLPSVNSRELARRVNSPTTQTQKPGSVVKNPFVKEPPVAVAADQPPQERRITNSFHATQLTQNSFGAQLQPDRSFQRSTEGDLLTLEPEDQVESLVPQRQIPNHDLQPLKTSDVAAKLVRQQAEEKLQQFKPEPKLVMSDKFYGKHTAVQSAGLGNYQAKINLPKPKMIPSQVVAIPNNAADNQPMVMRHQVPAQMASTGNRNIHHRSTDTPIEKGLAEAAKVPAKSEFALRGKCPVSLLSEGRWVDGDENFGCIHRNRIYLFANKACLTQFQSDPDAYSPILAGYDPVIYKETGNLVDGKEEYGVFMGKTPNQRIVLFDSMETRTKFQANPRIYLETVRQAMSKSGGASSDIVR